MRILTITAITALALPLMALGQTTEPRTDARTGADQGHAGYSAGEREEDESPGGAE